MMVPDLTDSNLAAYFLDPQKSGIEIEQRARAASIAAAGKTQSGMQLTASQATGLAARRNHPRSPTSIRTNRTTSPTVPTTPR
jgi:hypothetical protein